jgi:3-phenylpropionate/trans-cinnamate dioxygenase ferredoxin subunit
LAKQELLKILKKYSFTEEKPAVTEFIEMARASEFSDGRMTKVTVSGMHILLAKVNGKFYATELFCPHLGADLSGGTLRGTILTCPMHHSQFELRDGHVVRWTDLTGTILVHARKTNPPRPLKCYPVRVDGDKVLVDVH